MDADNPGPRIRITDGGPYLVTGGVPLTAREPAMSVHGEPLEWDAVDPNADPGAPRPRYALCRCGGSANKPYCDGTHAAKGFDGELTADRGSRSERARTLRGRGVVVTDDESRCVHAGFCGTRFTNVWKMTRRTDDPEVRARLTRMVANCPSGRLEVATEAGDAIEPTFAPSIATIPDGPLWVRGGVPIEAADGHVYEASNRVTLCRCGRSKNKPFCDGTHAEIDFQAP